MRCGIPVGTLVLWMASAVWAQEGLYVSASGSDQQNGRSPETAVRTIHRALRVTRHGDTIHLERGGEYDSIELPSARGVTFKAYGQGPRPILRGHKAIFAPQSNQYRDITFEDMHLIGPGGGGEGVVWRGATDGLTFRRCVIENYRINILIEGRSNRLIRNVRVEGCVVRDSSHDDGHSHGLFAGWVHGLTVRDSLFDRNGRKSDDAGTPFNHALYIQTTCRGIVFENNVCSRNFADGGQFRTGGVVRDNVSIFNPMGFDIGGVLGGREPRLNGIELVFDNNVIAYPGDINPNEPRGIGVRLGNLRTLRMHGNTFLFARGGEYARNTAIRIVDVGEARVEQLSAAENRVQGFPRVVDDHTGQDMALDVVGIESVEPIEPSRLHAWLDEAAQRWGEGAYHTATLRAMLLGQEVTPELPDAAGTVTEPVEPVSPVSAP